MKTIKKLLLVCLLSTVLFSCDSDSIELPNNGGENQYENPITITDTIVNSDYIRNKMVTNRITYGEYTIRNVNGYSYVIDNWEHGVSKSSSNNINVSKVKKQTNGVWHEPILEYNGSINNIRVTRFKKNNKLYREVVKYNVSSQGSLDFTMTIRTDTINNIVFFENIVRYI